MPFGFDINDSDSMRDAFLGLVSKIAVNNSDMNKGAKYLYHNEIRSLARVCIASLELLCLPSRIHNETKFLLGCIAAPGLPHYDRSNCARMIQKIIKKHIEDEAERKKAADIFAPSEF